MTLRVVVVDDERPARSFLIRLLKECHDVELVGEAGSGEDAIALIARTQPDLAFLDLQMPEIGSYRSRPCPALRSSRPSTSSRSRPSS